MLSLNNVMRELVSSPQIPDLLLHSLFEPVFLVQNQGSLLLVIGLTVPVIVASVPPFLPGVTAGKAAILPSGAALFTGGTAFGTLAKSATVAADEAEDAGKTGKGSEGHENGMDRTRSMRPRPMRSRSMRSMRSMAVVVRRRGRRRSTKGRRRWWWGRT